MRATASDLRQRLGLGADAPIGPAVYAAFLARRLRNGPLHFRQLWRLWRSSGVQVFRCSGVQVFRADKDGFVFDLADPEHPNT